MGLNRAKYEAALARADRALYEAAIYADALNDEGAREDLEGMKRHIFVLMDDSLRARKHRPRPDMELRGQMTVDQVIRDVDRHASR